MQLVECVPNFSEGQDKAKIQAIADAISNVADVSLLHVDSGFSTNRTVITFVGPPEAVIEGAFRGIQQAANVIDMSLHKGEHARIGATDVCPLVPIANITMDECVRLAERLGQRVGNELGIPVYLYAEAARSPERGNLANIRKGQYEGLPLKMQSQSFKPDFGPFAFNAKSGATVIGARQFLIAYNVNLNSSSKKLAAEIASTIRESGRAQRDSNGAIVKDSAGTSLTVAGTLKACRAVGWHVEEFKRAQVSINLIDYTQTSLHHAFDEVCRVAEQLGLRVTGSELVGLVPLQPMLAAGRHYLIKQGGDPDVSDGDLIETAVESLGLSELSPFDPAKKIVEYVIAARLNNPDLLLNNKRD